MKKLNTILIIVLIVLLCGVGVLGFTLYNELNTVKAPSLDNATLNEVNAWCESLKENPCKIDFDYSETVAKDMVIYQSIKEGEKVDDTISFTVSLGKKPVIVLPDNINGMTREEVSKWAFDNGLSQLSFKEENSDSVEAGKIIRVETPAGDITAETPVTVILSSGAKSESDKKVDGGEILIEKKDYIGNTVSQFESKVKKLNLVPYHNEDRDAYSDTVAKGSVVWHGSGSYVEKETISYGISLGQRSGDVIEITKNKYQNKTVSDFESAVKALGLVPKKTDDYEDYSDSVAKGNILWHGSGEYEKDETIRYSVSLGKKGDSSDIPDETYVNKNKYQGKTVSEFETAVKALGLVPSKTADYEDYSDTVTKGNILWHGYGDYEKGEKIRYSVSLGKKGSDDSGANAPDESYINKGQYVGKSVADFEKLVKALGLVPSKTTDYEDYSDTVVKGYVIWHGSGNYEKGETIRYSLSLGKKDGSSGSNEFYVSKNTYQGKTVTEFETLAKNMGLVPSKTSDYEDYSDTVAKGNILWHGYGDYEKGETIRYSVSLGKKSSGTDSPSSSPVNPPQSTTITVTKGKYVSMSVNDFETAAKNLGLSPSKTSDYEGYSDTIAKGNVIWHGSGDYTKGETIRYSVSLGPRPQQTTVDLAAFADLISITYDPSNPTFDNSKANISSYLSRAGFTNYTITGEKSNDSGVGVLLSVYVDGAKHGVRKAYAKNAEIVVKISTGVNS